MECLYIKNRVNFGAKPLAIEIYGVLIHKEQRQMWCIRKREFWAKIKKKNGEFLAKNINRELWSNFIKTKYKEMKDPPRPSYTWKEGKDVYT